MTFIDDDAFYQCFCIGKIILAGSTKVELGETANSVFNYSPVLGGTMSAGIFVPDNLVDIYKSDTNWAPAAGNIKPLSQLPTE